MLRQLRIRLTLLYLISAILLSFAVGGGTYFLVTFYFKSTNDQALRVKMGLQFAAMGIPLPLDLYDAVRKEGLIITNNDPTTFDSDSSSEIEHHEGLQESELADIYILAITENGELIPNTNNQIVAPNINTEAVDSALRNGEDFRNAKTVEGVPVRLFTYRAPIGEDVQVFQIGRYLTAQNKLMKQLLNTMIILGGMVTILFGIASWILAGRTIKPSQSAWDKQQSFVANASHELRTPLTLIRSGVELSLRKTESKEQKELLSDVLDDTRYMTKLIEEMLLLSRLDSGSMKLNYQLLQTDNFFSNLLRQFKRISQEQSIHFSNSIQYFEFRADPIRLKQIILILFDNALRNTPSQGDINLVVEKLENQMAIILSDTGQGIQQDALDKVFDRFYKSNNQSSDDYRGSGLGLAIAKSLVEAHHGTITISSQADQGTKVIVKIPMRN